MTQQERELVSWICGVVATLFGIAAGAMHGGWAEALAAGASGFSVMGVTGAYANKPAAPKA